MDEELIAIFQGDFPLLIEAGFLAVKQMDEVSATRLFEAARTLRPKSTAHQIGIGYIALNKLDIKEAIRIYESVTQQEPDNHLAQVFLGISYMLSKDKQKKGAKIVKETIEKTSDDTVKHLGNTSLEWYNKDLLKKSNKPFFAQTEKEE